MEMEGKKLDPAYKKHDMNYLEIKKKLPMLMVPSTVYSIKVDHCVRRSYTQINALSAEQLVM